MKISIKNKRLPLIVGILAVVALMGIGIVAALGGTTTISGNGTSLFPQGLNASTINSQQWSNIFGANVSDTMNYPVHPASVIIWANASSGPFYAKNGSTSQIMYQGTDAAATIQYAINALPYPSGGSIYITPVPNGGFYPLYSPINLTSYAPIKIYGADSDATVLTVENATTDGFFLQNATSATIEYLTINNGTYKSGGGGLHFDQNTSCITVFNVNLVGQYDSILMTSSIPTKAPYVIRLDTMIISNFTDAAVAIQEATEVYMSQITTNPIPGNQAPYGNYGLHIYPTSGYVVDSGIYVSDCDFMKTGTGLQIDGTGNVEWLFFVTTCFDGNSGNGISIGGGGGGDDGISFVNCWSCTNGINGLKTLSGVDGLIFASGQIYNNNQSGAFLSAGTNIKLDSDEIAFNNIGNGGYPGMNISTSNVTIEDCKIGALYSNVGYGNPQTYALNISGSLTNLIVTGNDMNGNPSGAVNFTGTLPATSYFANNVGFVTSGSGSLTNTTATTFVFAHGLAGAPMGVWASFNTTAVTGYSWTANATYVTVTVAGTLPASMTCYWTAQYNP